jgi:hypothetical protein
MTRLSCHRFRSNEVRLALSLLAYNLGNLWRRLALPRPIEILADEFAATAGENRRTAGEACALLLAATRGGTSEPAAVRSDAGSDRDVAGADGIDDCRRKSAMESVYRGFGQGRRCCKRGQNIGQSPQVITATLAGAPDGQAGPPNRPLDRAAPPNYGKSFHSILSLCRVTLIMSPFWFIRNVPFRSDQKCPLT